MKSIWNWVKRSPAFFLLLYFIVGCATIKQYGLPLDDFTQYVIGKVNYEYINGERSNDQIDVDIRYYGPVFETLCFAIDSEFQIEPQPTQKWGMRHVFIFLLFTLALASMFAIVLKLFQSRHTAWIVMLLLAFYPRVFADAHYNSKDTLFLALLLIGLYPFTLAMLSMQKRYFVLSAFVLGLATTIRLSGFLIIPVMLLVILMFVLMNKTKISEWFKPLIVFVLVWLISYYAFFPALWLHPLSEFATLVHRMQAFPWPNETLIGGEFVGPTHRVWWYLPVWFGITMPVTYLVLFVGSLIAIILSLKNKMKQFSLRDALLLFFLLWFLLNMALVMFTKPTLYDSWRQFQFLIVPFLIVSGFMISKLTEKRHFLNGFILVLVYHLGVLVYLNPAQYVYFNEYYWLLGQRNTYDQDYWSVSTEHCVDWLDRQQFKKSIYIYTAGSNTGWLNLFFYQNNPNRQFFIADSLPQADFEIETIRNRKPFDPTRKVVYSFIPLKDTIARIIQLK